MGLPGIPGLSKPEGGPSLLKWEDDSGTENFLQADAVKSRADERRSELTRHAVEDGADISDHVIQTPDTLTLELLITNHPTNDSAGSSFTSQALALDVRKSLFVPRGLLAITRGVGAAVGALFGSVEEPIRAKVLQSGTTVDRVNDFHDSLISLKQSARPVTITFQGRVYPNMILVGVRWTQSAGEGYFTGQSAESRVHAASLGRFVCEFESFRTVATATATLPDPADLRAKATAAKGKKKATELQGDAEENARAKASLLSNLTDLF